MRPKLETLTGGDTARRASVAPAHAKEHHRAPFPAALEGLEGISVEIVHPKERHRAYIAAAVAALAGIAAVLYVLLKGGSASQIAATIAASASIAAAVYTQFFSGPVTRRKSDADETFSSAVGPWLDEARRRYAKEKLSGGDTSKL